MCVDCQDCGGIGVVVDGLHCRCEGRGIAVEVRRFRAGTHEGVSGRRCGRGAQEAKRSGAIAPAGAVRTGQIAFREATESTRPPRRSARQSGAFRPFTISHLPDEHGLPERLPSLFIPESRPFGQAVESCVRRVRSVCAAESIPSPSSRSLPRPVQPATLRQNRHSKQICAPCTPPHRPAPAIPIRRTDRRSPGGRRPVCS